VEANLYASEDHHWFLLCFSVFSAFICG